MAGSTRQFKAVVAQLKTGVSVQSIKRPVAPPVYRPQPVPKVLQTKSSLPPRPHSVPQQPIAPPVYRPEQKRITQLKTATPFRNSGVAQASKSGFGAALAGGAAAGAAAGSFAAGVGAGPGAIGGAALA